MFKGILRKFISLRWSEESILLLVLYKHYVPKGREL
jgi:hypothetical protein